MGDGALADVRRALVIGLGASGRAAVRALSRAGVPVVASEDDQDAPAITEARELGAEVHAGVEPTRLLDDVDLVVPSPGVPEHAPVLQRAMAIAVPIWSEPELGWRLHPHRVVAVTGTNGKTSTTELTQAMLEASGVAAVACGNIGLAFTDAAAEAGTGDTLVAELSSFQLRFCTDLRPAVGVLLNLAPDHLDWHGTTEAYGRAKARMWQAQTAGDWAVANADDDQTVALVRAHAPARVAAFAVDGGPGALERAGTEIGVVVDGARLVSTVPGRSGPLLDIADLQLDAPHHVANTAAAACAALLAGGDPAAVARAAADYHPGHHRLETVDEIAGVRYVDDSKATNAHAAAAALGAFERVVWIAGGLAKGVPLATLADHLGGVLHAVLIGAAADELAEVCGRRGVPTTRATSMAQAVAEAAAVAGAGDTVLLAPACASFDMFRDYADRGEQFAEAVRNLRGGAR